MKILKQLEINKINAGASTGTNWWSATANNKLASHNPANGELIAEINQCSVDDYEIVVQAAVEAAKQWREIPAPKRGDIIRQIGNALRELKDPLGSLVSLEMGKSKQEGDGEVQEMIDMADFAVGQSRMLYGNTMHSERPQHRMYEQWHPYGVVGIISAFNFPVAVWAWNAFLAVICGNSVIWKPSSKTPLCAIAVQHICNKIVKDNHCPAIFNLFIPENHDITDYFINDKRVPLISFTGSTGVGRYVAQTVAARLGRTILELGGNNAIIVDGTANLKITVPAIVFGAVGTAGQRCTTTRRLFIFETLYDILLAKLVKAYQQISIGDPLDTKNLMGPLVDKQAVVNYKKAIADVRQKGGKIAFGGNTLDRTGFYVEPTIITDVDNQWDVVQRETFAPILYVMKYSYLNEAIAAQNSVPQGLSSALFTSNLHHAERYLSAHGSDCGIANINIGTSGAEIGGAFGGEKDTGGGREAGSDAWKSYMRRQTTTINWGIDLPSLAQGIKFDLG